MGFCHFHILSKKALYGYKNLLNRVLLALDKYVSICYNINMKNKIIKILIVLFVFILSSLTLNKAFASSGSYILNRHTGINYNYFNDFDDESYSREDYYNNDYNYSGLNTSTTKSGATIVNNYYNSKDSSNSNKVATTSNSNSNSSKNVSTSNIVKDTSSNSNSNSSKNVSTSNIVKDTSSNNNSNSNDNVYGGGKDVTGSQLTALAVRGSGSFMPSSIWQWILVTFLILIIIILIRIITRPRGKMNTAHA